MRSVEWGRVVPRSAPSYVKMSKNLRWKKLTDLVNDDNPKGSGMDELKSLINNLLEKIDKLDTDNKSRHDALLARFAELETTTTQLRTEVNELKTGLDFTNNQVDTVKISLEDKADHAQVKNVEKRQGDLEN